MITRRAFTLGTAMVACTSAPSAPMIEAAEKRIADIESDVGGRIGVCALAMGNGARIAHRAEERFATCSTFKWMLVAAIGARVTRGFIEFDDSVAAQCDAVIVESDNVAANALLKRAGGPSGLTQWIRTTGDETTRIDRDEPALNENAPGDPRDTSTPDAMVKSMKTILFGDVIEEKFRTRITDDMKKCETGKKRLRAGFPKEWTVGDKTGTGERGAVNDVAIVWRKYHSPILVACFMTESKADIDALELAHTRVARVLAETFG
jgi:beta-lactamase class A